MNRLCVPVVTSSLLVLATLAGPTFAGTFSSIAIDDSYADWAGVPVVIVDPADGVAGSPDFDYVQIANDNTYLYIRRHYHAPASPFSSYVAIDNDNDAATGFNVFGLGLVGSEAGYVADFDFDQRAGFNIGTLKDPVRPTEPESGSGTFAPFADTVDSELAIRLDTTFDPSVGSGAVFPTNTFKLLFYSLTPQFGFADVAGPTEYTLAVPEPATMFLAVFGAIAVISRRRAALSRGVAC